MVIQIYKMFSGFLHFLVIISLEMSDEPTKDRIVETTVDFEVHSSNELQQAIDNIRRIKNVDEVARVDIE